MAKLCPQCDAQLEDRAVVCVHCGSAADEFAYSGPEPHMSPARPFDIPNSEQPTPSPPIFSASANSKDNDLNGIGGWLILPTIGLVIGPFRLLSTIINLNIPYLYGSQHQVYLSSHLGSATLLLFELASNTIFIIFLIYLNFLLFAKKKAFPTYMIICLIARFCVVLLDTLAAQALHPTANLTTAYWTLVGGLLGLLTWIPYFRLSRRVKATFVR
ncbi:MAG: DUF2569 family protein [Terracidiphilus sp.]|jgi:hypothetical protein